MNIRILTRCAFLSSLATLMQIASAVLPGPGTVLAAFNTLPIAIAGYISPFGGCLSYFVSGWITFLFAPSKAPFLVLCTAPFGLAMGIFQNKNTQQTIAVTGCTLILTIGFVLLAQFFGIRVFGFLPQGEELWKALMVYISFATIYSFSWINFLRSIIKRLKTLKTL